MEGLASASHYEIERRAQRLLGAYNPRLAWALLMLSDAWVAVNARTKPIPEPVGNPDDPLTGLPPNAIFGDSNEEAQDAARYPRPRHAKQRSPSPPPRSVGSVLTGFQPTFDPTTDLKGVISDSVATDATGVIGKSGKQAGPDLEEPSATDLGDVMAQAGEGVADLLGKDLPPVSIATGTVSAVTTLTDPVEDTAEAASSIAARYALLVGPGVAAEHDGPLGIDEIKDIVVGIPDVNSALALALQMDPVTRWQAIHDGVEVAIKADNAVLDQLDARLYLSPPPITLPQKLRLRREVLIRLNRVVGAKPLKFPAGKGGAVAPFF